MSRWRSIWLVARREILERGRSRGFILSVAVHDRASWSARSSCRRSSSADDDADQGRRRRSRRRPALEPTLEDDRDAVRPQIVVVDPTRTGAPAEAALTTDAVEAVVDVPADLSAPGEVVFKEEPDQRSSRASSARPSSACASNDVLTGSDVDQAGARRGRTAPPAAVELDPQTDADRARVPRSRTSGWSSSSSAIFTFGFTVLTGVVEEKQSRVVEVVLSTVRPRDLLIGKVLGIGVLGLVQLVVFVVAGLVAGVADRSVRRCPSTTPGGDRACSSSGSSSATRCTRPRSAFLGALASRMEEASNASTPGQDHRDGRLLRRAPRRSSTIPTGTVARIATFIPPSRRWSSRCGRRSGRSTPWEIVVSAVVTMAGDLGAVLVGGPGLLGRRPPDRRRG